MRLLTIRLLSSSALGLVFLGGCVPDLGECDEAAARRVAFVDPSDGVSAGLPLYEGQALIAMNCANGTCHASGAMGVNRNGAPAGLDFDVRTACDERGLDGSCPDSEVERLRLGQRDVHNHRFSVLQQVEDGDMPPGAAGRRLSEAAPRIVRDDGSPLPAIDTADGRRILRNWLSCGSPVVERTVDPGLGSLAGDPCDDGMVGRCVVGELLVQDPPAQSWDSIYEVVIGPYCGESCHSERLPEQLASSNLDLSTPDLAYDSMVGIPAFGDECSMMGTQIVPSDADGSLLVQKLEGGDMICGDRMPVAGPYMPQSFIDVIRAWIDDEARR